MRLKLGDEEGLEAISPIDLLGYLRSKGWKEARRNDGAAEWVLGDADVLVPLKTTFLDYARRMLEAVQTLADIEGRSELAVFRDIKAASADVIRVRALAPDFSSGSMPVSEAIALVERSRELLLAAACAAANPRPVFHTRRPQEAVDFLQRVRMGQTEFGSYVVTLQAPVPPALQPVLPHVDAAIDEPFERRSTRTLLGALHALQGAVEEATATGSADPFMQAVPAGVSANLCDAVIDLYGGCRADAIELSINWAAVRPATGKVLAPRITLAREWIEPLKSASSLFRAQQPESVDFEGYVVKLERDAADNTGVVTLYGAVAGTHRRVRLDLAGTDYNDAIRAHGAGVPLRVSGELQKEGRSWVLRTPHLLASTEDDLGD